MPNTIKTWMCHRRYVMGNSPLVRPLPWQICLGPQTRQSHSSSLQWSQKRLDRHQKAFHWSCAMLASESLATAGFEAVGRADVADSSGLCPAGM